MSDITKQSLSELVENIKSKKLSSSEVTKAFVERSEKSKELNAYITEDYANALNKAKKFDEKPNLDLKLPGIPMSVKDLIRFNDFSFKYNSRNDKVLEKFYNQIRPSGFWRQQDSQDKDITSLLKAFQLALSILILIFAFIQLAIGNFYLSIGSMFIGITILIYIVREIES